MREGERGRKRHRETESERERKQERERERTRDKQRGRKEEKERRREIEREEKRGGDLVDAAASEHGLTRADPHGTHPVRVALKGLLTVARLHLPLPNRRVSRSRVPGEEEALCDAGLAIYGGVFRLPYTDSSTTPFSPLGPQISDHSCTHT
jgi:hypothetical protein